MTAAGRWSFRCFLDTFAIFLAFLPWIILHSGVEPYHRGFFCNDESLRHPYKDSTIPSTALTAFGLGIPITIILIVEAIQLLYVPKKKGENFSYYTIPGTKFNIPLYIAICYKVIGVFLFGAAAQQSFTNIGKYSTGRLRPHFFAVCQPDYPKFNCTDEQGLYVYVTGSVCTGTDEHQLKEMRLSFPSGHTSLATYCMVFLVLYLQSRMTWTGSKLMRPFIQVVALWVALGTGVSRISDYKHHWSDVLGGAILGVAMAILMAFYVSDLFKGPKLHELAQDLQELLGKYSARHRGTSKGKSYPMDIHDATRKNDGTTMELNGGTDYLHV